LRLSQTQMADILGVVPETLSRIETGHRKTPGYLLAILELFERDETAITHLLNRARAKYEVSA